MRMCIPQVSKGPLGRQGLGAEYGSSCYQARLNGRHVDGNNSNVKFGSIFDVVCTLMIGYQKNVPFGLESPVLRQVQFDDPGSDLGRDVMISCMLAY